LPVPVMARKRVRQYPDGSSVKVAYDPRNPEYAVLERGVSPAAIVFMVVGIILSIVMGFALVVPAVRLKLWELIFRGR